MIGFPLRTAPVLEVKVEKPIAVMACSASNSHDTGSAWADAPRREKCCKLSSLEPVSCPQLLDRLKAGLVTVLDVRPEGELPLAICKAPSTSRSESSKSASLSSTLTRKSSLIVAGPTACCPMKRSLRSGGADSMFGDWKTDFPNAGRPGYP
jgi:hypothetical protein